MSIPNFERTVIDGVPFYVGDATGEITVGLMARVGIADEHALERGITELVAELSAIETDGIGFGVGDMYTSFVATGTAATVTAQLAALCEALATLDPDDLQDLADTVVRTPSPPLTMLQELVELRYGWELCGARGLPPLFLFAPDVDRARQWSAKYFTRDNIVGWSTGPLGDAARLPLPAGTRHAEPDVGEPLCTVPSYCAQSWIGNLLRDVVEFSMVVPARDAQTVALRAFVAEVAERLSETPLLGAEAGLVADPWGGMVHIYGAIDVGPRGDEAIEAILGSIDDFIDVGPDPDEMIAALSELRTWASDPASLETLGITLARDELHRGRPRTLSGLLDDLHAVTPEEVADSFSEMLEQVILIVPDGVDVIHPSIATFDADWTDPVAGTDYGRDALPGEASADAELVVGEDGVTLTDDTIQLTTRFDECVAALEFADGPVTLFSVDGTTIDFRPDDWIDGVNALAAIKRALPADIVCKTKLESTYREPNPDDAD